MTQILIQEYYDDYKQGLISLTLEHETKNFKCVIIALIISQLDTIIRINICRAATTSSISIHEGTEPSFCGAGVPVFSLQQERELTPMPSWLDSTGKIPPFSLLVQKQTNRQICHRVDRLPYHFGKSIGPYPAPVCQYCGVKDRRHSFIDAQP